MRKYINKNLKNKFVIIMVILILMWDFIGTKGQLVEDLAIPISIGYDLLKKSEEDVKYSVPVEMHVSDPSGSMTSQVIAGEAKNIGGTRGDRQLKSNKKFLLGLEKVLIVSEEQAFYGIKNILDILTNNSNINDKALFIVCKGKAEDVLKDKVKGYANSGEYIAQLIKNAGYYNFFTGENNLINAMVRIDAEGRSFATPYIELKKNGSEITGLALFEGDKMVAKTNLQEAKIINLLRDKTGKGMLTIQKNNREYVNYYAKSKRKVKCYKEGEKYKFIIDIDLNGTIESNELYKNINNDIEVEKKFIEDMENSTKKMCEDFLQKSKSKWNTDFIGLGKFAVAKYGRHSGVDWNRVVPQSDIYVNVKVKVETQGRGDY